LNPGKKTHFICSFQVVVVVCERDLQLQRLMETRHLSERESILLIDTQMAQEDKAARYHSYESDRTNPSMLDFKCNVI